MHDRTYPTFVANLIFLFVVANPFRAPLENSCAPRVLKLVVGDGNEGVVFVCYEISSEPVAFDFINLPFQLLVVGEFLSLATALG